MITPYKRKPAWLKVKPFWSENYRQVKKLLSSAGLNTVCQEANCPNIRECFGNKTATFLILGKICTRGCSFCNIQRGIPLEVDSLEPMKVAQAARILDLKYVVITSVTRDDLKDGGASIFAESIDQVRKTNPVIKIEVLIPDFRGSSESLKIVLKAEPDVLNHNLETVKRLYPLVRSGADYNRSLEVLQKAKRYDRELITKSGIMVGLGEKWEEIVESMQDLRKVGCDILTIGQYLSPSENHLPIDRYYTPEEFGKLKEIAKGLGFLGIHSGPLVRSSYLAHQLSVDVRLIS
ncbi:MAG: lipoyl synthase [candidate division Zixibacteria bacterium]|nr:lipoyl synthase [candidate division Zixibacteria bacterium]